MTKAGILCCAAMAALIGAVAVATVANGASTQSSPAEKAATAELNRKSLADRTAAEAHAKQMQAQYEEQVKQQQSQYEEQKRVWEKQQAEYLAELKSAEGNP